MHVRAKPVRRPFQCAVQPWDARHKKTAEIPCHRTTTWHYKELLRTTPVLLRTTKYCKILQNTTPVLLGATKYYSVLQNTR